MKDCLKYCWFWLRYSVKPHEHTWKKTGRDVWNCTYSEQYRLDPPRYRQCTAQIGYHEWD